MKELIIFPTRSTLISQTLIDHFASNRPSHIIYSSVFTTGFSDHDLIYSIRNISSLINREPKIIMSHQLKNYDRERFIKQLQTVDWESILQINDVNIMSLQWERELSVSLTIIPQSISVKYESPLHHTLMFLRDFYKKGFRKTKNPEDWKLFQNFRNITNVEKHKKEKNLLLS